MPWLFVVVLLASLGLGGAAPAAAAQPDPSAAADETGAVKYYIVGSTGTSEREYLFQIAARTLGDGRRYTEILELNQGRLQPDGLRLEDPLVLMPGWILILPADASGPGVIFGPPPVVGSVPAVPPTGSVATPASSGDDAVRTVALVAVTMVFGVALLLLRRGRRIERPAAARAPLGTGPARSATATRPLRRPHTDPVEKGGAFEPPASPVDGPKRADGYGHPNGRPYEPGPASFADPTTSRVERSLRAGRDVLVVSLIGARAGASAVLLGRDDAGSPRTEGAVVRLGEVGPDALWVDLAASPDVVTITGARGGVRRQSAEIARQLGRAGVPTIAVGEVPGIADVTSRTAASLRELTHGSDPAQLLVVFVDKLTQSDVTVLHRLISRRRPRVVAVAIGSGPRSRWSIDVT